MSSSWLQSAEKCLAILKLKICWNSNRTHRTETGNQTEWEGIPSASVAADLADAVVQLLPEDFISHQLSPKLKIPGSSLRFCIPGEWGWWGWNLTHKPATDSGSGESKGTHCLPKTKALTTDCSPGVGLSGRDSPKSAHTEQELMWNCQRI